MAQPTTVKEKTKKQIAIVLGLCPTGLATVRSLGRHGVPVKGIDSTSTAVGYFSKYCQKIADDSPRTNEEIIEQLLNYGNKLDKKAVLMPTNDPHIELVSKYYEDLKRYYDLQPYDEDIVDLFLNKKRFYEVCLANDMPIPDTYYPSSVKDVEEIAKKIEYPCIIKPIYSHEWKLKLKGKKVFKLPSKEDLLATYREAIKFNPNIMIQQIIGGGDDQIFLCATYFNKNSEPLALFTARTIRQYPIEFGTKCIAESVKLPDLAELCIRFLKNIGFHGICGLEFKRDSTDGQLKMIEVNPRPVRWYSLTDASSVPVVYTAYRDLTGEAVEPNIMEQTDGIKWIHVWKDFVSSMRYIKRGNLSLRKWMSSLRGKKEYAVYKGDDKGPLLGASLYFASQLRKFYLSRRN